MVSITGFYAALLCPLYLLLSARVIQMRKSARISLGDEGNAELTQRVRAHGNFLEYTSIGLLLLALAELNGAYGIVLHALGLALLAGRIIHAVAFWSGMNFKLRVIGMVLSLCMIGTTGAVLFWVSLT